MSQEVEIVCGSPFIAVGMGKEGGFKEGELKAGVIQNLTAEKNRLKETANTLQKTRCVFSYDSLIISHLVEQRMTDAWSVQLRLL